LRYRVEDRHYERLGQMIRDLIDVTEDRLLTSGARGSKEAERELLDAARSLCMLEVAEDLRRKGEFGEAVEKALDASALGPFGAYLRTGAKLALKGRKTTSRGFARNRPINLIEIARQHEALVQAGRSPEKATQAIAADWKVSKSTVLRGRGRYKLLKPWLDKLDRLRAQRTAPSQKP
jgi:hypothetical protein